MIELNNITDLQKLINNQVEENLHLDYKSSGALSKADGKKKEIAKDVSSFANSDGGVIIYGIKEYNDKTKKHLPEKIDPINRELYSKEWLEQVINSNITPRIEGIKITPISVNKISNGVVYIVDIKKSEIAHQASDFRYYKRFNFESVAMYDYEIKDVMNRNKSPRIDLELIIEKTTYEVKSSLPTFTFPMNQNTEPTKKYTSSYTLLVYGRNNGGVYADYVNCFIEIPNEILDKEEYNHIDVYLKDGVEYKKIYCENTIREVKDVTSLMNNTYYKYWPSRYDPILPNTRLQLKEIFLKKDIVLNGILMWEIYADNAEKRVGKIEISEINIEQKNE